MEIALKFVTSSKGHMRRLNIDCVNSAYQGTISWNRLAVMSLCHCYVANVNQAREKKTDFFFMSLRALPL